MRVGVSFAIAGDDPAGECWASCIAAVKAADALGFDSAWIAQTHGSAAACTQPVLLATFLARVTRNILLRTLQRRVDREMPVRLAEEIALLDQFSRGRAGVAYASASAQGLPPQAVHEVIEFTRAAWMTNELRYRGEHLRFPSLTPDSAPRGPDYPRADADYLPQWEWGAARATAEFLSLTPRPLAPHVPTYVAIDDDATLEWAARNGVSPYAGVNLATAEVLERLARYRGIAEAAGRRSFEVDAVIERRVALDGNADAFTLGGSPREIAGAIRTLAAATRAGHFVWRSEPDDVRDYARFANEVQVMLQA